MAAKFYVRTGWSVLLALYMFRLLFGAFLRLPGWLGGVAGSALLRLFVTAVMTIGLTTGSRLVASVGRGHLAAVGVLPLVVFCAQIIATLG